jgi:histidine triad (HIT) family protein
VLVEELRVDAYNLLMNNGVAAGQDVHHAHLHITPRSPGDGYYAFGGKHFVPPVDDVQQLEAQLMAAARAS